MERVKINMIPGCKIQKVIMEAVQVRTAVKTIKKKAVQEMI